MAFYTYIGYPVVLWFLSRWPRYVPPEAPTDESLPTVSLLVSAYNEQMEIAKRVENALQLDYPADKLEIVIASDGSSDETAGIVRRYTRSGVKLIEYPQRRGKATVLNASIPQLAGRVIVLSDANTHMDRSALRHLVRWFANPDIGTVCGRLILVDPENGTNADGTYWRYESFLKRCEGRLGALLGATFPAHWDPKLRIPRGQVVAAASIVSPKY